MNLSWLQPIRQLSVQERDRMLVIVVIGASLLLVGWSLTVRLSLIAEAKSTIHSAFAIDQELAALRSQWDPGVQQHIAQEVTLAESRLLQGIEQVGGWLEGLGERARTLGFHMEYSMEKEQSLAGQGLEGVQMVPLRLILLREERAGAYDATLQLLRLLDEGQPRVDVKEVLLSGEGTGVQQVIFHLQVWMKGSA